MERVMNQIINIARQFSRSPAGRYREDGPYSGQTFREKFLIPGLKSGANLIVEMDGTRGYGSSFLDEAFGGLRRLAGYTADDLLKRVIIRTNDPSLELEVKRYLRGN
jgi:hypothetical protein